MRKIIQITVLFTLVFNISYIVSAGSRPFLLINDEFYADAFSSNNDIQDLYYENEAINITFIKDGNDPTISLPVALMGDISCDEYKVLAIKMKAPQPGSGSVYFATDSQPSLAEDKNVNTSEYIPDGKWHIVTVDFSQNENYTGYISGFRFDPYSNTVEGVLEIQWIGMFRSVEEAMKYQSSGASPEPTQKATPKVSIKPITAPDEGISSGNLISLITLISVFVISLGTAVVISVIHLKKSQNV